MKLEWIDDLIAIAETASLTNAADRRNVTQPAFSRRLRIIEDYLGADMVDRRQRPARPTPALISRLDDLRLLAAQTRRVSNKILAASRGQTRIVISCQHSLALSFLPLLAPNIRRDVPNIALTVSTSDRDECYSMLMTGKATAVMAYEAPGLQFRDDNNLVERCMVYHERLVPVAPPDGILTVNFDEGGEIPCINYPEGSFLHEVVQRGVLSRLLHKFELSQICETTLTPALKVLVAAGMGVAWLPRFLVEEQLKSGEFVDLSIPLGDCKLDVVMLRLNTSRSQIEEAIWQTMRRTAQALKVR